MKMNNNRQKATHPEKTNLKKIPQLQQLKLEQLGGIAGGLPGTGLFGHVVIGQA